MFVIILNGKNLIKVRICIRFHVKCVFLLRFKWRKAEQTDAVSKYERSKYAMKLDQNGKHVPQVKTATSAEFFL